MIPAGLSLDQAPPLSVPFRFFVTGAAFGCASGLALALRPDMLASRWTPLLLGTTHAFLLGFLVMTMLGALQQMLPVVAGAPVLGVRLTASVVHVAWTAGTLLLATGLAASRGALALIGAVVLLAGVATFLVSAARLAATRARSDTVTALRLALVAFAVAAGLGATLAAGHAELASLRRFTLTDLHLGWALAGWVSLLVAGVSWQVVPMLFMTPAYPAWSRRAVLAVVPLLAVASFVPPRLVAVSAALGVAVAALLATHAVVTLVVLARRRRAVPDASVTLFRLASGSLLAACAAHVVLVASKAGGGRAELAVALLHVAGFATISVVAMLLKIAPFLAWFHLQAEAGRRMMAGQEPPPVPTMKDVVPDARARLVAAASATGALLVVASPFAPGWAARLAGVALALGFALVLATLARAWRLVPGAR